MGSKLFAGIEFLPDLKATGNADHFDADKNMENKTGFSPAFFLWDEKGDCEKVNVLFFN